MGKLGLVVGRLGQAARRVLVAGKVEFAVGILDGFLRRQDGFEGKFVVFVGK